MSLSISTSPDPAAHIDVLAIERELTDLWKQAGHGEDGEEGDAVTRTCVLNLIVLTSSYQASHQANTTIVQLMASHPHRAFVVIAGEQAASLQAWVQAHCQAPGAGRAQVCCEQITIEAPTPAHARVPGVVLPLLLPDVPIMLWHRHGEPFDDQLFTRLGELCDRLIVDSATFANPQAGLARMAALIDSDTAVSDLSWGRLTPWRELIAQFFDASAMLPHLGEIAHVTVEYEASPNTPDDRSQALLLIGWLASRLGWRPIAASAAAETGNLLRMSDASGNDITVELRPAAPRADLLDRLATVTITGARARFSVARGDAADCAVARAEVEGMQMIDRVVRLERLDEAGLIAEELRLLGRDRAFEDALHLAATLF